MRKTFRIIFTLVVGCMLTLGVVGTPATSSAQTPKAIQWRAQVQDPAGTNFYKWFEQYCKDIAIASGGRLTIKVNPAGAIVPATQEFDAVSKNVLDYAAVPSMYWQSKWSYAGMFAYQVGGMSPMEQLFWWQYGGGFDIINKTIKDYNVVLIPSYLAPAEMYCGSNREIKSLADMKGLKFRTSGDDSSILSALGCSVISVPVGEVYEAMQRNVIDAYQIGTPWDDMGFKMHEVTKYWYLSPARQPSTCWFDGVNTNSWKALPDDLKLIVKNVAYRSAIEALGIHCAEDLKAIEAAQKKGVKVLPLPKDIEDETYKRAKEFYAKKSAADPLFANVYNSIQSFTKDWRAAWPRL